MPTLPQDPYRFPGPNLGPAAPDATSERRSHAAPDARTDDAPLAFRPPKSKAGPTRPGDRDNSREYPARARSHPSQSAHGFLKLVSSSPPEAPAERAEQAQQQAADEAHLAPTNRGFGVPNAWNVKSSGTSRGPASAPPGPPLVRPAPSNPREHALRENVHAAGMASSLSPEDARVVFALRVQECLEGGRAAILRPHRREQLVALSASMGFRPFDANLIIALVQDAARRGEVVANLTPRSPSREGEAGSHVRELVRQDEARASLSIVPDPGPLRDRADRYRIHNPPDTTLRDRVILAVVLALLMLASMITLMGA